MARITPAQWRAKLRKVTEPPAIRKLGRTLYAAGEMVAADAATSITTGAVSGANHVASLPGEAPNSDTHLLDRSIETELVGISTARNAAEIRVEVSANAPYAKDLERGNSRMEARPFMGPALRKNRRRAVAMIKSTVNEIVRDV